MRIDYYGDELQGLPDQVRSRQLIGTLIHEIAQTYEVHYDAPWEYWNVSSHAGLDGLAGQLESLLSQAAANSGDRVLFDPCG